MSSQPDSLAGPALGRPARARTFGDRRGLTVVGSLVLVLVVGLAGVTYDVLSSSGLGVVFAACFIGVSALTSLLVHREDLLAAAVLPPLTYVVLAVVGAAAERRGEPGGFVSQQALALLNAVVLGAPVLVAGTVAAVLLAGVRALATRRG